MKYNELMELFQGSARWKTVSNGENSKSFSFNVDDVPFLVIFRKATRATKGKYLGFWSVSFDLMGRDDEDSYKMTGDGKAIQVMGAVVDIVRHVVKSESYPNIIFTADNDEPSRVSLYRRLVANLAKDSGYKLVVEKETGAEVFMMINSKTQRELGEQEVMEAPKTAAAKFYTQVLGSEKELLYHASTAFGGHPFVKRKQADTSAYNFKYYIKGTNTVVGRSTADGKFFLAQNPNNTKYDPKNNPFMPAQKSGGDTAPKAAEKPTKRSAPKLTAEDIVNIIRGEMKSSPLNKGNWGRFADDDHFDNPNTKGFSVRNWGEWELPNDVDPDEEDYDWEVMTDKTSKALGELIKKWRAEYPDFNIWVDSGEKNWIYIQVTPK